MQYLAISERENIETCTLAAKICLLVESEAYIITCDFLYACRTTMLQLNSIGLLFSLNQTPTMQLCTAWQIELFEADPFISMLGTGKGLTL